MPSNSDCGGHLGLLEGRLAHVSSGSYMMRVSPAALAAHSHHGYRWESTAEPAPCQFGQTAQSLEPANGFLDALTLPQTQPVALIGFRALVNGRFQMAPTGSRIPGYVASQSGPDRRWLM
jgi:hypothetical protein